MLNSQFKTYWLLFFTRTKMLFSFQLDAYTFQLLLLLQNNENLLIWVCLTCYSMDQLFLLQKIRILTNQQTLFIINLQQLNLRHKIRMIENPQQNSQNHIPSFLKAKRNSNEFFHLKKNFSNICITKNNLVFSPKKNNQNKPKINPNSNLQALIMTFFHIIKSQYSDFHLESPLHFEINKFINDNQNIKFFDLFKSYYMPNKPNVPPQQIISNLNSRIETLIISLFSKTNHKHIKTNTLIQQYFVKNSQALTLLLILLRTVLLKVKFPKALCFSEKLETRQVYFIICDYFGVKIKELKSQFIIEDNIFINKLNDYQVSYKIYKCSDIQNSFQSHKLPYKSSNCQQKKIVYPLKFQTGLIQKCSNQQQFQIICLKCHDRSTQNNFFRLFDFTIYPINYQKPEEQTDSIRRSKQTSTSESQLSTPKFIKKKKAKISNARFSLQDNRQVLNHQITGERILK